MPITITVESTPLDTKADMLQFFDELTEAGWIGALAFKSNHAGEDAVPSYYIDVFCPDPNSPTGVRSLTATIGDLKVVRGSRYEAMTPAAFDAAYGGN